jgi:hypothetical protein
MSEAPSVAQKSLDESLSERACIADCTRLRCGFEALQAPYGIAISTPPGGWPGKGTLVISRDPRSLDFEILEAGRLEKITPFWGLRVRETDSDGGGLSYRREGDGWHLFRATKAGPTWELVDLFDSVESEVLRFFGVQRKAGK